MTTKENYLDLAIVRDSLERGEWSAESGDYRAKLSPYNHDGGLAVNISKRVDSDIRHIYPHEPWMSIMSVGMTDEVYLKLVNGATRKFESWFYSWPRVNTLELTARMNTDLVSLAEGRDTFRDACIHGSNAMHNAILKWQEALVDWEIDTTEETRAEEWYPVTHGDDVRVEARTGTHEYRLSFWSAYTNDPHAIVGLLLPVNLPANVETMPRAEMLNVALGAVRNRNKWAELPTDERARLRGGVEDAIWEFKRLAPRRSAQATLDTTEKTWTEHISSDRTLQSVGTDSQGRLCAIVRDGDDVHTVTSTNGVTWTETVKKDQLLTFRDEMGGPLERVQALIRNAEMETDAERERVAERLAKIGDTFRIHADARGPCEHFEPIFIAISEVPENQRPSELMLRGDRNRDPMRVDKNVTAMVKEIRNGHHQQVFQEQKSLHEAPFCPVHHHLQRVAVGFEEDRVGRYIWRAYLYLRCMCGDRKAPDYQWVVVRRNAV